MGMKQYTMWDSWALGTACLLSDWSSIPMLPVAPKKGKHKGKLLSHAAVRPRPGLGASLSFRAAALQVRGSGGEPAASP